MTNLFNRLVVSSLPILPKSVVYRFAKRYIAGDSLEQAVQLTEELNQAEYLATLDLLGEDILHAHEAKANAQQYHDILTIIEQKKLQCNISVKPTALGLKIDTQLCLQIMQKLCTDAKAKNNFVRFEMEDSSCTDDTLQIFSRLRKEHDNVGLVLQVYLRRTQKDLEKLLQMPGLNIRLCKGVYVEPEEIAFGQREEINQSFSRLLELALRNHVYVGIATHDPDVVQGALRIIQQLKLKPYQYEFQMLLGVGESLREMLLKQAHRVRIYIPFGKAWHAYSMRRLKKNPKIAGYIMRDLFAWRRSNHR